MDTDTPRPTQRILLVPDKVGWSLDRIARQVQRNMGVDAPVPREISVDVECLPATLQALEQGCPWDTVVCLWYGAAAELFARLPTRVRRIVCVYDYMMWNDDSPFAWTGLRRALLDAIAAAHVVMYACPDIDSRLRSLPIALPRCLPCTDGVDLDLFRPQSPRNGLFMPLAPLVIGWAGNSTQHGALKGLQMIRRVADGAPTWLRLKVCDASDVDGGIPYEQMPAFYAGIDVYVCMSFTEGTPNPVLEAAASRRPFVSTRVGVVPMLIDDATRLGGKHDSLPGVVLRERSAEALRDTLYLLYKTKSLVVSMGASARATVERGGWSWSERARHFAEAFV